jgi:hypothetical protein
MSALYNSEELNLKTTILNYKLHYLLLQLTFEQTAECVLKTVTGASNNLLEGNNTVGSTIIQSKEGDDGRRQMLRCTEVFLVAYTCFHLNLVKTKQKFNNMFQLIFEQ